MLGSEALVLVMVDKSSALYFTAGGYKHPGRFARNFRLSAFIDF
jgi:hypothetical protein